MKILIIKGLYLPVLAPEVPLEGRVIICGNSITKVYHVYENCGAYKRCEHKPTYMSKVEAEKIGLRQCR